MAPEERLVAELERLRALHDGGLLTRGDLYDRITALGVSSLDAVARVFSDEIATGLGEWQRAIAGGARVFGGESSDV